ncbi:hypothetical protein GGI20_002894 [Coemansia sp. BCRC 34301]|nr:hypothetical protein GGI20_002894 [Coemansia sp. BCRC 34301]
MRAKRYAIFGVRLLLGLVCACAADAQQEDSIEAIAKQVTEAPPPPANAIDNGLESIVQRMAPLVGVAPDPQQEADWASQLAGELSRLVDDAAASLGQSREQVFGGVDALVRARGRRNPNRPRFNIGAIVDTLYNDQSKRFIGRMTDLFRQVVSAYVKSATADAVAAASSASTALSASTNTMSKLLEPGSLLSSSQSLASSTSVTEASSEAPNSTSASAMATTTSISQAQPSTPTSSSASSTSSKIRDKAGVTSSESDDDDEEDEDEDEEEEGDDDKDKDKVSGSVKPKSKTAMNQ